MNSRQLQYAVMLSETRSFSHLAEQLCISQPALSKQILSLEQELDVRLFDRSTTPLTLTPAGEYFIQQAKDILFRENQLVQSMEGFRNETRGKLTVGISPFRSLYLIPHMVQMVRSRYPGVQICLHEVGSDLLRKEASEGKYDFAIVNLPVDESVLDVIPLEPDTLVLVLPKSMLGILNLAHADNLTEISFADCKDLPFIAVGQTQEMRRLFDKLCTSAGFSPNIIMEVVGLTTAWAMTCAGIGATLLPLQFVSSVSWGEGICLLAIKESISLRQPAIVTKRGQYLSEVAKFAITSLSASSVGFLNSQN